MSDYASILGGNAPDSLVGQEVGLNGVGDDWDAFYSIQTANVFLDRFDTTGDSIVDAVNNPGSVQIEVGSGTDAVFTGVGDDSIWAGSGNDRVGAGEGTNTVSGAAGRDLIDSRSGDDSLMGGAGADTITAGAGNDHVTGGSGNDELWGGAGADTVFGGSGDDSLRGEDGDDTLSGGSGADTLLGAAGDDSLLGGSGGDVFAFDDGFGQDVIGDFKGAAGDRINLAADLNGTGIETAADVRALVSGGTTETGTKYTLITVGEDTIRLDKVDPNDFLSNIESWVRVG